MKELVIVSRKHGQFICKLDTVGYKLSQTFGNGSGKWNVTFNRGKPYLQKRTSNGIMYLHRLIAGAKTGDYIDHINLDTLDNRSRNLRITKNSTNLRNGSVRTNNTSGVTGVRKDNVRGKWCASIKVDYKTICLGRFKTRKEAVNARKEAEKKYWNV